MKPRAVAVGAAALVALAAATMVGLGWLTPYTNHYVTGADVSRHQGPIDWKALAATDVRFVYIKASEGADHRDERFAANWRDAGATGLKRGAYHFFTLCRPGAAQAANFIAAVPRADDALPPAVDIEQKFPCRRGPTMTDIPGELTQFLDIAEAHYGVRPLVYTTGEFDRMHLQGAMKGERFWLRALLGQPDFRRDQWVIWQFDHDARRPGVSGKLDLNYFRGDAKAFEAFAADAQAGRS